jgi:predicted metalloendopeptidase
MPQNRLTIDAIGDWMTPFLSRLYVLHYVPEHLKKNASAFVKEIKEAANTRMNEIDWLSPKSREAAKEKIDKMITTVAYPDSFRSLKLPRLQSHNFIENILSLGSWRTEVEFHRLGELRNKQKDWDESVFAVNAYYFSIGNEIVIPSGSLEWPFYDESDKLIGLNYGGLGAILGHEMTHGFDEDGKEYDPDGFRKRWWSQADIRAYATKAEGLISLFNKQKIFGYHVNGSLTLSENIADLGGLGIAMDALRVRIEKENLTDFEKKNAYKQFFTAYAISWRIKEKKAKILQGLFVDRHAPAFLRVNLIVAQFQEWYDAFDIKDSDPMYIEPEKRIRIF